MYFTIVVPIYFVLVGPIFSYKFLLKNKVNKAFSSKIFLTEKQMFSGSFETFDTHVIIIIKKSLNNLLLNQKKGPSRL